MLNKSISKFVAAAAVSTMVITSVGTIPEVNASEVKWSSTVSSSEVLFSDVPVDYTHTEAIYIARDYGILNGYKDGTFKPYQSLTRANVVKALGKYILAVNEAEITDFDLSHVKPFSDVPSTHPDKELYNFSLLVRDAGIFSGDKNNNLAPANLIQRQQMAKVLVETFGFEDLEGVESGVKDNAKAFDDAYRAYINILSENGVTVAENFNPAGTTTRGQFASFLVRSVDATIAIDMVAVIEDVNTAAVAEDLENPLASYFFEDFDINRLAQYFEAMKEIEFETIEEIQAIIDSVNAQTA